MRDTYDATITVLPDKDNNSTFYLDAIRVYNPMSEEDAVASEVYEQAGEANAVTKEVRDELLDAGTFGTVSTDNIPETAGSVYIDKNNGPTQRLEFMKTWGRRTRSIWLRGRELRSILDRYSMIRCFWDLRRPPERLPG